MLRSDATPPSGAQLAGSKATDSPSNQGPDTFQEFAHTGSALRICCLEAKRDFIKEGIPLLLPPHFFPAVVLTTDLLPAAARTHKLSFFP